MNTAATAVTGAAAGAGAISAGTATGIVAATGAGAAVATGGSAVVGAATAGLNLQSQEDLQGRQLLDLLGPSSSASRRMWRW